MGPLIFYVHTGRHREDAHNVGAGDPNRGTACTTPPKRAPLL